MRERGPAGLAFTERERRALRYCTYCPRMCRFACPVAHGEARESVTPWGLMRLLNLVDQGHVTADGAVLETLEHCVSCGRCQSYCKHDNPVAEVLGEARAQLVARGLTVQAPEAPDGGCLAIEARPVRHPDREDLPVFIPACVHLSSPAATETLRRGLEALEAAGLALATPAEGAHQGCGFREWERGQIERARGSWARFGSVGRGRPACLTDCAPPLWTLEIEAPEAVGSVDHLLEWLYERLDDLPRGHFAGLVAVHDACHETRRLGLADALRAVVGRLTGGEPRDLYEARDRARCCGATGRWASAFPAASERAADTVVDDVADSGADLVVTPNPHCRASLQRQVAARGLVGPGGEDVEVVDLIGLVALLAR